jgi:hypothetical protein
MKLWKVTLSKKFYFTDLAKKKNSRMIKPASDINIPDHINKEDLRQKISELFSYRMFPWLLSESDKTEEENSIFMERLFELQESIYLLDAMLESKWEINEKEKEKHWQHIIDQTKPCLTKDIHPLSVLQHIKKYEKHEIAIRSGHWPVRLSMSYFYFYKSCDVKLLRRLIYEKMNLTKTCGDLADWRYYDLITEVNDDVEDLMEDLQFINGNRFLISLLKLGKEKTLKEFTNFLNQIFLKSELKLDQTHYKLKNVVFERTNQQVIETLKLMIQTIENLDEKLLGESKLLSHLQQEHV